MEFYIQSTFRGVRITDENNEYTFKSKIFSHHCSLSINNGDVIASLKRRSWWRMDFDLFVGDQSYQLKQRLISTKLLSKDTETCFATTSGHDFFLDGKAVMNIEPDGLTVKKYKVKIHRHDHWQALLIATCLHLRTSMVTKAG